MADQENPFVKDLGNGWKRIRIPLRRRVYPPWWAGPRKMLDLDAMVVEWRAKLVESLGREPTDEEEDIAWNEQVRIWNEEDKKQAERDMLKWYGPYWAGVTVRPDA